MVPIVTVTAPAEVDTASLSPGNGELARKIPLRRLDSAEEVASTIYFLCSPRASYATGTEVHINGGRHV